MENRYLFRSKRIDNGEWAEGYLFERRYDNGNPFEAYIIQDAYEQLDVRIRKEYYGSHPVLISPLTEREIDKGYGCYRVNLNTICQCTGLKDKNGKLIWENDILVGYLDDMYPENATYAQVIWDKNGFYTKEQDSDDISLMDEFDEKHFEVCGNIFDNPELLEVGE